MKSVQTLEEVALNQGSKRGSVVTIGNFDGFHLGHQGLAAQAHSLARTGHFCQILVTFHPHPREVVSPGTKIPKLTRWSDLTEEFKRFHFDVIVRLKFDHDLKSTRAEDFLKKLREKTAMAHLVVGHDFHLGADRTGDAKLIESWCQAAGVGFHQIQPVLLRGVPISSGKIRADLERGDVLEASVKLGRPFSLAGLVSPGDGRGRQLGFPTANLKMDEDLLYPKHGVYAGHAVMDGKKYLAVCNIGVRPTFSGPRVQFEVHILNFQGDLYGREIRFEFAHYLREELKFNSADELKSQIQADIRRAVEVLS